jgi:multicomponent Na+:H+ antiporter subunit G
MTIMQVIAVFWLAFGLFFYVVGVLGTIRLPDAYSRLHASGKVGTMGLLGILLGVGFLDPGSILKLAVLGLFVAITSPAVSHAIAKADKSYSEREENARDSSISAEGAQADIEAMREQKAELTESRT